MLCKHTIKPHRIHPNYCNALLLLFFFLRGSPKVASASLVLSQPPKCWDYRCASYIQLFSSLRQGLLWSQASLKLLTLPPQCFLNTEELTYIYMLY
jgi:hypothetical protein